MNHLGYIYGEISVQAEFQGNLLVGPYWVGGRAREDKTGGYRIPPCKTGVGTKCLKPLVTSIREDLEAFTFIPFIALLNVRISLLLVERFL